MVDIASEHYMALSIRGNVGYYPLPFSPRAVDFKYIHKR